MKILILTNNFVGLYSFRMEVVKALMEAGHEIIISAPNDACSEHFRALGCQLVDTRFNRKGTNPLRDLALMLRYCGLLRKKRPDVVLSYTIKPNIYGGMACLLCKVPQIANITGLGSAVENPGWLQRLTIILYKVGMRSTRTVFFQNQANKDFCERRGLFARAQRLLIPGSGVNLRYHALQDYPSQDRPLRFIFISRLLREKGIEEYLECARRVKSLHPDVEFHILGSCEEEYGNTLALLQERGIVVYHGQQSDVRPFIGRCHCTVHPSFYPEGMSNVLLESCAAGRPIITTDRPGCGEIVDDGKNGFVVRQQDSDDLTSKILHFIGLPYAQKRQMGLAARQKVEAEFDRQIVVRAYLAAVADIKR